MPTQICFTTAFQTLNNTLPETLPSSKSRSSKATRRTTNPAVQHAEAPISSDYTKEFIISPPKKGTLPFSSFRFGQSRLCLLFFTANFQTSRHTRPPQQPFRRSLNSAVTRYRRFYTMCYSTCIVAAARLAESRDDKRVAARSFPRILVFPISQPPPPSDLVLQSVPAGCFPCTFLSPLSSRSSLSPAPPHRPPFADVN